MKLLLDTHALIWWWADDPQLSASARSAILDDANEVLVSAVSAWEMATKFRIGKLPSAKPALKRFNELIVADGFTHLAVGYQHAIQAGTLDLAHRDPFDRMLAAQAQLEAATLVTTDNIFESFQVKTLW